MGDAADDAYDAAMWEDDEPELCDCPDKVPANPPPEGWSCPKCDAQWWPDDEKAAAPSIPEGNEQ